MPERFPPRWFVAGVWFFLGACFALGVYVLSIAAEVLWGIDVW